MLNPKKTQCIFIVNRKLLSHIPLNNFINYDGEHIYLRKHVKSLGAYIDRYMFFDIPSLQKVSEKWGAMVFILNKIALVLSTQLDWYT